MSTVLSLFGGWPGHRPHEIRDWTRDLIEELECDVVESSDTFALDSDLTRFDLSVMGWNNALTTEDLSDAQEHAALGGGVRHRLAAWHGALGAAPRPTPKYHLLSGG